MITLVSELCLPGTYSEDGLEQCTTCQEGFYQNKYGQMSCIHCPDNTTTYRRGVRRLSMCRGMLTKRRFSICTDGGKDQVLLLYYPSQ